MSEHGWPDDHHDDDGGGFEHHHEDADPLAAHEDVLPEPDPGPDDDHGWPGAGEPAPAGDPEVAYEHHAGPPPVPAEAAEVTGDTGGHVMAGADPDTVADTGDPVSVFPPAVDVGELPEPVDGFPWIDTGSLGLAGLTAAAEATPDPGELAEYAAADLPPGVDPWAALAESDDPATSALARFWGSPGRPDQP